MEEEKIGERIKKVRSSKKLTQKQLSELSKIDSTSISRYENGTQIPNLNTLAYISIALDTSLDYLVFGNEPNVNISKKSKKEAEEEIFESLATLIDNKVIESIRTGNREFYMISQYYKTYDNFVDKYDSLEQFQGLIGISFNEAKKNLIKSFVDILKKEKKDNELPF